MGLIKNKKKLLVEENNMYTEHTVLGKSIGTLLIVVQIFAIHIYTVLLNPISSISFTKKEFVSLNTDFA